ncbi:regulation of nuclear pre-mRNA domain-containing protein 2a isoform X2 [Pangasianodon hypophthalmus]|uniref:regulation of nuclear pre-mRNA domain-containing protein 2a isoform X2 n=1 Tax=Pangasianodon hypophthalmus TaxID=310915 RepID=UPI002307C991|nr:regulation of nuclear pre-mRNA domain-containing protein 2a isoform X2 [Pangasianodon hypophthalmus]
MAAGGEAVSGNSRGSSTVLESTLDRRFQGISNTMESIQGLSTWCIENKKYHSVIVRSWLKWLRKSEASHRLNLFYLANDVIQNCKRRNAIVYRTTFTDVLPEAIKLISTVKDAKVRKSVHRILSIWEERNVYSEELINQLKGGLIQQEEPPAPANPKAELRSKIVAEFLPSAFIEHLTKYRNSMDEIELREKQLAAMRVDVCSTVALKKLKDKAGGKRFSKDFEDGSAKLQDFVAFLDGEVKKGPALIEALENADIFYEMQYKEVKIVTNAYQTFANRVLHLKKKLDALKASLPDPDDSPIPSPSEDAPSPTGSESPFHGLTRIGTPDPELDGQALEEDLIAIGDAPSPLSSPGDKDNRDVEDMELSDVEELAEPTIIVEEGTEQPGPASVSNPTLALSVTEPSQTSLAAPESEPTTPAAATTPTAGSLPINLAGVDLGKISSIISTLTNVMKNTATGVNPAFRPSTSTSSTLSSASSTLKSPTVSSSPAVPASNSLAKILSRVDINPGTLLNVLSKTQAQGIGLQGLSSFLNNQTTVTSAPSGSHLDPSPEAHASPNTNPVPPAPTVVRGSTPQRAVTLQSSQSPSTIQTRNLQKEAEDKDKEEPVISVSSTLDSKIDGFLQGNPGLRGINMGFPPVLPWTKAVDSPSASAENLGGTPVRDESGATPTQDEVMDEPAVQPFLYQGRPLQTASTTSASAPAVVSGLPMSTYANDSWQEQNRHVLQYGPGSQHSGNRYKRDFTVKQDFPSSGLPLIETGRPQHVESLLPSSMADKNQNSNKNNETLERISLATPFSSTGADNASLANDGWYCDARGHDQEQRAGANSESYKGKQHQSEEHRHDTNPPNFFNTPLPPPPPIPQLPPPPQDFVPPVVGGVKDPTELTNIADSVQAGGDVPVYRSTNPVSHDDYDERLFNRIPATETFHPHLNTPGPRHSAVTPHPVRLGPQNGPVDFNHRPRVPVHNQHHPGMPRPSPPSTVRGYHEALSPSHAPSEDAYLDPHCDAPPRSPSPPLYNVERPVSPHTRTFYPEERAVPLHHPEPRLRPQLEHRPPPPHHYRPPRPGHYPPQRPLRRPPPPHIPHPGEPPFQRGKRHGLPFGGPSRPAGPFYPPKRPFMPPRY